MNREVYASIKEELGFKPAPGAGTPKAPGAVMSVRISDNIAYVSGHVAFSSGELMYKGRIGAEISIEDGAKSAALSVVNCLESLDAAVGLENVEKILKVNGFLSCTDDVVDQPIIMNGGSRVLIDVFGDAGRHARAALGIHTLPLGASTEVDMVVELKK